MATASTVFIVDDDPSARESLAALADSMQVAAECFATAEEFLAAFDCDRPGCLITDMRMPGLSGLDLQRKLLGAGCEMPIILITAFGDVPLAVRTIREGAFMFLEKNCTDNDVWETIRKALRLDAERRAERARRREIAARVAQLTVQEHHVMSLLIEGKSNSEIAKELSVALRTAETRRQSVLQKMKVDSLAELIALAMSQPV